MKEARDAAAGRLTALESEASILRRRVEMDEERARVEIEKREIAERHCE